MLVVFLFINSFRPKLCPREIKKPICSSKLPSTFEWNLIKIRSRLGYKLTNIQLIARIYSIIKILTSSYIIKLYTIYIRLVTHLDK